MAIGEVKPPRAAARKNIPLFPYHGEAVTPDDNTVFPGAVAVRVNVAGDLVVKPVHSDTDVTFTLVAGEFCPVMVEAVRATGTTATGIIAVW